MYARAAETVGGVVKRVLRCVLDRWVVSVGLLAVACAGSTDNASDEASTDSVCPDEDLTPIPSSAAAYAKMCEPHLGVVPTVDCGAGVPIPITVDGVEVFENPGLHGCDNPSLQMGDCMPGSSVQRHAGTDSAGSPLPEVTWLSFCRHDGRGEYFGFEVGNSVQLIGYNEQTGATCFFESGDNSPWTSVGENNRLIGVLPGANDPEFDDAYSVPGDTQCVQCHQSDPFIHNPWIKGATLPENPDEPVVPIVHGPNSPYFVVGGGHWDMRTIHIENNGCQSCHRVAMETLAEFTGDGWEPNEHMPPLNPGSMADDLEALMTCWTQGPENTPGCDWVTPPAGECEGEVVTGNYPYASDAFNLGVSSE